MSDRRYDSDEVRRIFADAAEAEVEAASPPPPSLTRPADGTGGMTLAELQEIGSEVGLSPALVARAAGALDRPDPAEPSKRLMGVPVQVKYQETLPANLFLGLSLGLLLGGIAFFFAGWKAAPEWAETRAQQMRDLATRARELASEWAAEVERIEAPRPGGE